MRRTDVPADVQSVPWMPPPAVNWPFLECAAHIAPSDEEAVE